MSSKTDSSFWKEQDVSIQLNPATVSYFVYNPLLTGLEGGVTLAWANDVLHVVIPIYALAIIAYEMLTGRQLFKADSDVQLAALQERILQEV